MHGFTRCLFLLMVRRNIASGVEPDCSLTRVDTPKPPSFITGTWEGDQRPNLIGPGMEPAGGIYCAPPSEGVCLEGGSVDNDCCASPGNDDCAAGYTHSTQVAIQEGGSLWDRPSDQGFYPKCGEAHAGNTCCTPNSRRELVVGEQTTPGDMSETRQSADSSRALSDSSGCEAWGYESEDRLDCYGDIRGMLDDPNHACWSELSAKPTCCGHCGPWQADASGQAWHDTCHNLDIVRVTPGCSFEARTVHDEGTVYDRDTNFCYNGVGCDKVRRIRVFGTPSTSASASTSGSNVEMHTRLPSGLFHTSTADVCMTSEPLSFTCSLVEPAEWFLSPSPPAPLPPPPPLLTCSSDASRVLACIRGFTADEWRGCTSNGRFECHCHNDDGVNYCCGSENQAEAIRIWEEIGCAASASLTPPPPSPPRAPPSPVLASVEQFVVTEMWNATAVAAGATAGGSSKVVVGSRPSISYNAARAECSSREMALCSKDQLCPGGSPYDGGVSGSSDTWVPVSDGIDEWLQYGADTNDWCSLHSVQYAPDPHPCHTHPDEQLYPDEASCEHSYVYCCSQGSALPAGKARVRATIFKPAHLRGAPLTLH